MNKFNYQLTEYSEVFDIQFAIDQLLKYGVPHTLKRNPKEDHEDEWAVFIEWVNPEKAKKSCKGARAKESKKHVRVDSVRIEDMPDMGDAINDDIYDR